ncbi:hypothetical protein [Rhodopseudomonas parapalustris]
MDENLLIAMRRMAWQRAKGELNSILECYFGDGESFETMNDKINEFIQWMENESPIS